MINGANPLKELVKTREVAPPPVGTPALAERSAEQTLQSLRQSLYGDQLDVFGKRLDEVEGRLEKRLNELSQRVSDSFAAFEKYVRRELKSHVARLDTETEARDKHFQDTKEWMEKMEKETDSRVSMIEKEVRAIDENCRNDLSRKMRELQDSLQKTEMGMRSSLDKTVAELEEKMAGRSQIGELLREMGERMNTGGVEQSKAS